MDPSARSQTPQALVFSQPSQSSSQSSQSLLSPAPSESLQFMAPPPPRSSSLCVLQTPKVVRVVEGGWPPAPAIPPTLPAGLMYAPRSSSIPTMVHTPAATLRTPHGRADATPSTPGRTPGRPAPAMKTTAEICGKVAEWGVQLTPEQLKSPTYELLHPVYQAVVRVFLEPTYAFNDDNEVRFIRDLVSIVKSSGLQGFNLVDLAEPDPKRTKRILSAILTFNDFREARMLSYEQALSTMVQHHNAREAAAREVGRLQAEKDRLERQRQENEPEVRRLTQAKEALVAQLRRCAEEKGQLEAQKADLRERLNLARDHNASLRYKLQELGQEIPHLSQGLVHSPARIRQESETAHEEVERGKAELCELDRRCVALRLWLDKAAKAETALEGLLDRLREIGAQKQRWKEAKGELRRLHTAAAEGAVDQAMQQELERLQMRHCELSTEWNRLHGPDHHQVVDVLPVSGDEQDIVLQDVDAQVQERIEQIQAAEAAHRAEVQRLLQHFQAMEQKVRSYAAALQNAFRVDPLAGAPQTPVEAGLHA